MKKLLSFFQNLSIRFQLLLGIGLVLFILIILFSFTITKQHSDFLHAQGLKQAETRSMMLAANAKVWVMANDYVGLEEVVNNFIIHEDLLFAAIINMDGKVIAHTDQSLIGQYIADETRIAYLRKLKENQGHINDTEFFVKNGAYIDVAHIIHFGDEHIGWVHLRLDQSLRLENINKTIRQGIIFTLASLLIGFLLSYLTANRLTRQLLQLIRTMKLIRQGNRSVRSNEKGIAEVSQLSAEFNRMLNTLNKNELKLEQTQEELCLDIKQRAKVEKEIRHLNENLENRVKERTKELVIEKNRAEQANQSKSIFLANMSHELRTPLNAVLGFSELMQNDSAVTASQCSNLTIIHRSGEHLLTLINDILEMSKIEAGRIVIEVNPTDLGELVRDVIDMMKNRAEAKHLQLLFDQTSSFPRFVSADAPKLRQIIINLLSNAVKFTEEGGITLRLGVETLGIKNQLKLLCEVEDSGKGISIEDQQQIFKPFIQVGQADSQTGTGLGLAITRQYIELMGGDLQVESELGRGSTFKASLLVGVVNEDEIEKVLPEKGKVIGIEQGQSEYRILSVEDKWENQLLLLNILESAGFQVKCVGNGEEAVTAFAEWQPQLIWMDQRMPIMSGLEATRHIRKMEGGDKVIIIALTASVFKEQMAKVLESGADDFLRKPYKPHEIYGCIAKYLGVRYLYEETELIVDKDADDTDMELTTEMLSRISENLIAELHKAVIELDIELSQSIIDKIRHENSEIAATLSRLLDKLDFKSLKQILEKRTLR
ncbi:MAG: response regulator [gamma proteobacterium symbiont of Taylorina sp.]|nr:response regulator [gamma proteobacterium symbiont of Taylorina sp.]